MRRLSCTRKKIRGVPRRLRSLAKWANAIAGRYPVELSESDRYVNFKIPVHQGMVEGAQSTFGIRRECAQRLIEACINLIRAKPASSVGHRVVATICVPNMFASEVCIYVDRRSLHGLIEPSANDYGSTCIIHGRSLAAELGFAVPQELHEIGMIADYRGYVDPEDWYTSEHWFYGELE